MALTFNGKEVNKVKFNNADVNYVIKDGKLVWANPNLYLRAPARSRAEQGFGTPIINTGVTITDHTYGLDLRYRAYQLPWEGMLMLGNVNSYRFQTDKISLFGTTNDFSKRTDFSPCRMIYDGPANTASLYWGDGTSETIEIASGTSFNIGPQRLGSAWDYNTGFDYYYYKLFKAGKLIQHFVPVPTGLKIGDYTVPSNGMWDIVTQQFFGNIRTGEFSYGKDE